MGHMYHLIGSSLTSFKSFDKPKPFHHLSHTHMITWTPYKLLLQYDQTSDFEIYRIQNWNGTHLETAAISVRCKELMIWVSILDSSCRELVHRAFSNCKFPGMNPGRLLWIGHRNVCATTLAWGWSWNLDTYDLRYWRLNSPASSRISSPSMLSWEASNRAINPSMSSSYNVCLSSPLLSQNLSNTSVRCNKQAGPRSA